MRWFSFPKGDGSASFVTHICFTRDFGYGYTLDLVGFGVLPIGSEVDGEGSGTEEGGEEHVLLAASGELRDHPAKKRADDVADIDDGGE